MSAQIYITCAVAAGDVYCWGNAGLEFPLRRTPTRVGGVFDHLTVSKVSLGHFFACAIAEGEVYCWGRGAQGQLGHGVFTDSVLPVKVGGALAGKTVTEIAAGRDYACAIADARASCWGAGDGGKLGDGSIRNRASPVAVGGLLADVDVSHIPIGSDLRDGGDRSDSPHRGGWRPRMRGGPVHELLGRPHEPGHRRIRGPIGGCADPHG